MLDEAQTRLVVLILLSLVTLAVAFGFLSALRSGSVSVGLGQYSSLTKLVRRADNPGAYWRIMMGWAFVLLICLALFGVFFLT